MNPIALHPIIFYFLLFFVVGFMSLCVWLILILQSYKKFDVMIFIDKSNRWSMVRAKLSELSSYEHKDKKYLLADDSSLVNEKGKSLFVFSENKPAPMKLEYNDSKWLSSESIMSIINNDLIQKLVQTSNSLKDSLILFGAIGGMIAGIASVIIMLRQFGVF